MRTSFLRAMLVLLATTTVLPGCGPGAPPETRAGDWHATTDIGEFTLTVDPSGRFITQVAQSVTSGHISWEQTFVLVDSESLTIIEGRKLTLILPMPPSTEWKAKFSRDGKTLDGKWTVGHAASSAKFKITR